MGKFNVDAVKQKGAMIENRSFSPDQPVVPEGKLLVAVVVVNPSQVVAKPVTHPADYSGLVEEYQDGQVEEFDLYLLDEDRVPECLNEG